jgi:uncharacterized protein (DUF433 family)
MMVNSANAVEIFPGVVVDPQISGGTPVIAGTRVPVEVVLGHLAAGDRAEEISAEYDLSQEQVRAAIGYAAQIVASERVVTLGPAKSPADGRGAEA